MLNEQELYLLCQRLELSEEAQAVISNIRNSEPSRRVQGRAGNVPVRYASKKMRRTIQAESHRNELAGVREKEHDKNTLEYYDQPPSIKLEYHAKSGRKVAVLYTPDYFVIRKDAVGWEEWKMEEELVRLSEESPNRYVRGEDGRWHCPPAERYAEQFGFFFHIRSSAEIDWVYQRNMLFLEDYLRLDEPIVNQEATDELLAQITDEPGISLDKLLKEIKVATSDDIYTLVATEQIYVDLYAEPLAEPDRVHLFRDQEIAHAYIALSSKTNRREFTISNPVTVAIGVSVMWDGKGWMIVNDGEMHISLLAADGALVELPRATFETLVKKGKITGLDEKPPAGLSAEGIKKVLGGDKKDLQDALKRYNAVLSRSEEEVSERTLRSWKAKFRDGVRRYGNGFLGLFSQRSDRGNRVARYSKEDLELIDTYISDHYETLKQQSKIAVYRTLKEECKKQGKLAPSYKTFRLRVKIRDPYKQKRKRKGDKAAYPDKPVYWELEVTTPRHGDRPHEIAHIDHTQLDIELIDSRTDKNLGRPWATFMVDAFSRRLTVYLTFDPPSYRSCMMVLREYVRRYGRLPQSIVTDGGKEFNSVYFESLLALYGCSLYKRPWAEPHYGTVCERLFNTANTEFVHNLTGNTQIMKNVRQVTPSVNPKALACWTLGSFYEKLCEWAYDVYDKTEHFTLGQSPQMAFERGLIQGGVRPFTLIPYDETFRFITLPTTRKGTAKVQHDGVKIKYIRYWSDAFRSPAIQGSQVPVRYDPFDMGIAYAFVQGRWVQCISEYRTVFAGRSEREIDIATKVLRRRYQDSAQQYTMSSSLIAGFLTSLEADDVLLQQRLHDMEAKPIRERINSHTSELVDSSMFGETDEEDSDEVDDGDEEQGSEAVQVFQSDNRVYALYEDF
jgi:putative transposase